ncbi:aminoglycoside adenylyltransferase domain-containing protein [Paenibacillus sp. GCM10023250]|uniref:aminoglycoside adenylyltransferase domain-containing protein n=1 Tax=Paenibacillus sp. GCM10023250 TaxID=3252648 RepID=UPI00361196EF
MDERLPEAVRAAMRRLGESLQSRLPDVVEAVYVYGSAALGAYVAGSSDIDFLVFVKRALTPSEHERIRDAHAELEPALGGTEIMGAYIRVEDAGKPAEALLPILSYAERSLKTDGTGDINPVTWWILRKCGIRAYGRPIAFRYELSSEALVRYVIGNMNTYWAGWIARLEQIRQSPEAAEETAAANKLDFAVEWCVLGMLRQWYTIRTGDVTSKIGAGVYGLAQLPERWHGLVREAMALKRLEPAGRIDSQLKRLEELIGLLKLIQAESNRSWGERYAGEG